MGTLQFLLWTLWCLTVLAYPVVQAIALLRTRGTLRWLAAFPLLFMLPAYALFLVGIVQGGDNNLSWLFLILPSPVALLFVSLVVLSQFVLPGEKRSRQVVAAPWPRPDQY